MFKKSFWNLLLFAIIIFGFIILAWWISGMVMGGINNPKNSVSVEIHSPAYYNYTTTNVCFQDNCIVAEIADTTEKQKYGLMFRTKLKNTEGMLFVFLQESTQSFYMKNTYIPLEIIWLDSNGRINYIEHAAPCKDENCTIYEHNAKYVLEINDNVLEDNNVKLGDYARIDLTKKE
jgi:uncharacterized protein